MSEDTGRQGCYESWVELTGVPKSWAIMKRFQKDSERLVNELREPTLTTESRIDEKGVRTGMRGAIRGHVITQECHGAPRAD